MSPFTLTRWARTRSYAWRNPGHTAWILTSRQTEGFLHTLYSYYSWLQIIWPHWLSAEVTLVYVFCIESTCLWIRLHGSFFQHGNNSGKRDTVAFHGACIECNMNVDMGMSIATLTCLAFQTYDILRFACNTHFFGIVKREYRSKNCVLFENVFCVSHVGA